MTGRVKHLSILTLAAVLFSTGCQSGSGMAGAGPTPLSKYIAQHKFTPFDIPRDGDGDGTVITFDDGRESIVAGASECLTTDKVAREQSNVFLTEVEYAVTRNAKLELEAAKVLDSSVDVSGAFNDVRVKKVKVRMVDPFRRRISQLATDTYLEQLPKENACRRVLTDKRNLVIHTILGANGVEYSFLGENDSSIAIDGKLLDQMNLTGAWRSQFEGKARLVVNKPVFIGYRAWKARSSTGFAVTTIDIVDVEPDAIEQIRSVSRRR